MRRENNLLGVLCQEREVIYVGISAEEIEQIVV